MAISPLTLWICNQGRPKCKMGSLLFPLLIVFGVPAKIRGRKVVKNFSRKMENEENWNTR